MRTQIILMLVVVFLIGCVPEPSQTIVQIEPVPVPVAEPEPMQVPEPEPEPVAEEVPAPPPRIVKHEDYDTVPVGSSAVQCENPERYTYVGGYCIEDACMDKKVKCMKQGIRIMRPECECWIYFGEPICSIKAAEETRIKSPLCTRKGQQGAICGAYDSNKGHCVNF